MMIVFLLATVCAGQCLDDFKAFRGLFLQHPSLDVKGEVRFERHTPWFGVTS